MVRMKFFRTIVLNPAIAFLFVLLCAACSVQEDDPDDPCTQTKLPQQEELAVQAYVFEPEEFCDANSLYWSDNAVNIFCKGFVQKYYCGGTPSGRFDFDITHYPDVNNTGKIPLGQLYQFKFDNEKDYIEINYELKAFFSDGKIFKTQVVGCYYYHSEISYDYINGKYYVDFESADYTWTPVN